VRDQPLLIALVAVQFLIHALGWGMGAEVFRAWRGAEGHFAAHWLLLACGLLLYVPAWPSGSAPRNLGDLLIVLAMVLQYRGMALHWQQRAADRACLALMLASALVVLFSLGRESGHGLRVATVCVGVALMLLATVRLIWQRGRALAPLFAAIASAGYAVLALALLARAVQALLVPPQTKISIDAPGSSNLLLVILVMAVGGLINLAQIRLVLGRVWQVLNAHAYTDALTETVNRRGLLQQVERLHQRARNGEPAYALLMIDVDHFKAINDRHGHAGGDEVLQRVARCLREGLRRGDVVARWGGEEFCVLLPQTEPAAALALAERLARTIAALGSPQVTVSIGLAQARALLESFEDVIRRADAALYQAKQAGRNRVVSDGDVLPV